MTNNGDSTSIRTCIDFLKPQENSLCVVLTGTSGLGKSIHCSGMIGATHAERLSEHHPTIRPLKYITVQDETSISEFAGTLLEALGDPSLLRDSAPDRRTQLMSHSALVASYLVPSFIVFGPDELEAPIDRDLCAFS